MGVNFDIDTPSSVYSEFVALENEIERIGRKKKSRLILLTGQRFGRLLALSCLGSQGTKKVKWLCLCDCGKTPIISSSNLRSGHSTTCGCGTRDAAALRQGTHWKGHTPEYRCWAHIKTRCYNSNSADYANYGGRGITVCDRWQNSFENFLSDMGNRPSPNHSIERKDNEKGYSPENCKWATRAEQNTNRRDTIRIEFDGRIASLSVWCNELNIPYHTTYARIRNGKTAKDAFAYGDKDNAVR